MQAFILCILVWVTLLMGIATCNRLDTLIDLWTNAPVIEVEEHVDWLVEPEPEDFLVV